MAVLLSLTVLLAACGVSSEDEFRLARDALEKNDTKAALIRLKSALQKTPDSQDGRLLLGQALSKSGDAAGAAVELEKLQDSKYRLPTVLPLLARAYLASGQSKRLVERLADLTIGEAGADAELGALLATAYQNLGDAEKSRLRVEAALKLQSGNPLARLLQIRDVAGKGAYDQAIALAEQLIADDPKNAEAHTLKGEILWLGKNQAEQGAKAMRDALAVDPLYVSAHTSLIKMALQTRELDAFQTQLASLKGVAPNHPETRFYEVQYSLITRDFKGARDGAIQLMRIAPDSPYVLQMVGAVEFHTGSLQLAELHLNKALFQLPSLPSARRLLAQTYLRTGQTAKAMLALRPLVESGAPGAETLGLMAETYQQSGDLAKAEQYFGLAAKADPDEARFQTAIALSQVAKGNAQGGFAKLEALASTDMSTYSDLALISARMRRNESEAALKAIDRLREKLPGKPLPDHLQGQIRLAVNDADGARSSFEAALKADAAYFPSVLALANLDVSEKKLQDAQKRLEAYLTRMPGNSQAMVALADVKLRLGAKADEVVAQLEAAVKANPVDVSPRLVLIDLLLTNHRAKAAVDAANHAVAQIPDDPSLMDALGRAQLAMGDTQQAISTFRKVAISHPTLVDAQLRLADAHAVNRDTQSSRAALRKALELSPKLLVAQRGLIRLAMTARQYEDALRVARTVQQERPKESVGHILEGEIQMAQGATDAALAAFRAALERDQTTAMASRTYAAYIVANRQGDGERFAESWIKDHPKDAEFLFHLGNVAMDRKDFPGAEARYRQVLQLRPEHGPALNNVALMLLKQGKPGALALAEKANQVLPGEPAILDTVAMVHAADKSWAKAIEFQRLAIRKSPNPSPLRLGLARYLLASGDKANAKIELEQLQAMGAQFGYQSEVSELLKGL